MGAGVMSASEFEDLLQRVEHKLQDMINTANDLFAKLRHWLSWLGPFGHGIAHVLEEIPKKLEEFGKWMWDLITNPGVPWTLWSHGNEWSGAPIAGKVSNLISKATADETRADDAWTGVAADAYKNTLPRQHDAMRAIVTSAQQIDDGLAQMAIAIGALWLALLSAIISAVVEFLAESAAASTGVGAPPAAAGAAGTTAKLLAIVSAALDAFVAFIAYKTLPVLKQLAHNLTDNGPFPDGHWPRSTTDLSDGSLSDGDSTDWHVRY
jgi:phage-related protein